MRGLLTSARAHGTTREGPRKGGKKMISALLGAPSGKITPTPRSPVLEEPSSFFGAPGALSL